MDCLTPNAFETLYAEVKSKSDVELVEMLIDKFETIAGIYQANVENGGQLGSLLLVVGAQMACDGLETLSDTKKTALVKVFSDFIDNDDDITSIVFGYKESAFDTLSQITRLFDSDDITKETFLYLIGVACVGTENKKGLDNVKKLFSAWF